MAGFSQKAVPTERIKNAFTHGYLMNTFQHRNSDYTSSSLFVWHKETNVIFINELDSLEKFKNPLSALLFITKLNNFLTSHLTNIDSISIMLLQN
jgi:hypothetical protein